MSTLPCCSQAPKRQLLEGDYKLVCVRGRRRVGREDEYLCVWDGYGPHGDTWEPESHLGKSQRLINALEREVSVKLDRSRFLVQDAIARQLTSQKKSEREAVFEKTVGVPSITDPEVAEALLQQWRRTRGGQVRCADGRCPTAARLLSARLPAA